LTGAAFLFDTRLPASRRSPKTIASAGHACWQAVTMSPSRTRRFSFSAWIFAPLIRWTQ
jgi:hypothetical protein